jgi:hypothetical protein
MLDALSWSQRTSTAAREQSCPARRVWNLDRARLLWTFRHSCRMALLPVRIRSLRYFPGIKATLLNGIVTWT